jgi:hypothetical protein
VDPRENLRGSQLRRAAVAAGIAKYVEDPLSEALIQGGLQRPATLEVYVSGDGLGFPTGGRSNPGTH